MDMSVNPDGMDTVDYSDFEYQQIYHSHEHSSLTGDNAQSQIKTDYEVLGGIGGLDNNEVAELAYLQVQVGLTHDQSDSDQDVGSETSMTGVVGANLPNSTDLIPEFGTGGTTTVLSETNVTAADVGSVNSEDRVFQPIQGSKSPAYDDQTNGTGGAGGHTVTVYTKPWRDLVGRGPVLDSSDNLSIATNLLQQDEIIPAQAQVYAHCVWDIAEVSDAGRAFSVPK